jgi:molecular chaperone GrpE
MPGEGEKGSFHADIPPSVLEDALRSVEKRADAGDPPAPPGDPAPPPEGDAARVAELQAEVGRLLAEGEQARAQAAEERERLLRAAADLENYRKRAAREKDEIRQQAVGPIVKDLLPAVDNLERALAAAPPDDVMAGGVRMVLKQVEEALARHGVTPRSALGQPFDPAFHEALAAIETPGATPGTVVAEQGRAWLLHGRLLRPAMVAVAAGTPPPPAPGPGDGETEQPA